jgi:hypothetical protein
MGDYALAPDVQMPNGTQLDGGSCLAHVKARSLEYAAAVRFVGLLAGVTGPLGTDQDVADARAAVSAALTSIGLGPPSSSFQAQNDAFAAGKAQAAAADALSNAESGWDRWPAWEAAGSPKGEDYSRWLETGAGVPEKIKVAARNLRHASEKTDLLRQIYNDKSREVVRGFFSSLWSGMVEAYNKTIAAIKDGTWKLGLCKLGVDAGFAVLEGLVLAGLAAFTGGVAAALLKIVRTAATIADKAVAGGVKLTGAVRMAVRAQRQLKAEGGMLRVSDTHAERPFRDIYPEKECTPDEMKTLGEEGMGGPSKTSDDGLAKANGGGTTAKKWRTRQVAGRKVYQRDDLIDPNRLDERGRTNLERMQKGLAPIGPDGKPLNLHHLTQDEPGPMAELTATKHSENDRMLHLYSNQHDKYWRDNDGVKRQYGSVPESVDRVQFEKWKKSYWIERALDF